MRRSQKYLALLLALVMSFAMSIGVSAAYTVTVDTKELSEVAADLSGKTVILHSNDVHGAVDGYAYIAALKADFKARGAEVILADAGDFSQGTTYVSISKGADAITMMNAAGYDVVTLGNHEFDFGYAQLKDNLSKAEFKTICANVLKDGETILDPTYVYETESGVKIGFFGLETPETSTKVNPSMIMGVSFLNNTNGKTDLYDCAALQVENLKKDGADIIIGLWHLGVDDESAADGHRSADVLAKTTGIDLVIDGHSHTVMTAGEDSAPIQSTGTKFANIGVIVIDDATKAIEDHYLISTEGLDKDDTVAAAAQAIADEVDAKYGAVFARSEVVLNGEKAPNGNRDSQTNNGNLITDAMKWSVLKEAGSVTVDADHVVAITNGGGIRAAIKVGDVTMKDINTVLPFGNTIAVVYVTGAELLEALEASTYELPIAGYPQTAGIQWTLDTTKEYDRGDLYIKKDGSESTYYGPKTINRVTIESINGKAFDQDATYAVVTNDFCADGGDTYNVFLKASAQFDTGIPLDEALMAYITEELDGVITAEKYGEPRGDLTIKLDPLAVYADVSTSAWYAEAVRYVVEKGAMTGTDTDKFAPNATITRAQVMTLIAKLAGDADKVARAEGDAHWYDRAVAWAVEHEISDGANPTAYATREEFAEMLYSYAKSQGDIEAASDELNFPDAADVSEAASEAMSWTTANGIITGIDGNLKPQNTTTRAQIATMLMRYLTLEDAA